MCCSRLCVWTLELKLPLLFIGEVCMWLKGVGTLRESITNQLGSIKPEMEMISWNSDAVATIAWPWEQSSGQRFDHATGPL